MPKFILTLFNGNKSLILNVLFAFLLIISLTALFGYHRGVTVINKQQAEVDALGAEVKVLSSRLESERKRKEAEVTSLTTQLEEIESQRLLEFQRLKKISELLGGGDGINEGKDTGREVNKNFLNTPIPNDVRRLLD